MDVELEGFDQYRERCDRQSKHIFLSLVMMHANLLSHVDDLGRLLLPLLDAAPSVLPAYSINPQT